LDFSKLFLKGFPSCFYKIKKFNHPHSPSLMEKVTKNKKIFQSSSLMDKDARSPLSLDGK
jgi:hypothetical protein